MAVVNPKYHLPTRAHLTTKLLPQLREATEAKVLAHVVKTESMSLTIDIWTDRRMHSFLAITGHSFLDFQCQSFLVEFEAFRGSHTGQHIAEAIDRCLHKYSLHAKVHYIVTDNASNMRKAFSVLEAFGADVDMDTAGLDDENLWNDIDSNELDDVSESKQAFNGQY